MSTDVQTFCGRLCGATCGIRVTVSAGKISDIQGDPESPFNRGNICPKSRALPELIYHPDRLKHPLKRIGWKGEGKWQQISRDEALHTIGQKLDSLIRLFGTESVLLYIGAEKGGLERHFIKRFASVLKTPNIVNVDSVCHAAKLTAARYTYGSNTVIDFDHPPKCLVVWGRNTAYTETGRVKAKYGSALKHGTQFIVIDPRRIPLVSRSVEWLKLRPGSDGLLALGMIQIIIKENLYDRDFVDNWTIGFNRLSEFVDGYPLGKISEWTWVPEGQIKKTARCFATARPAAIQWGNALDQTPNAFQTCRGIAILRAITGNLDVPGGEIIPEPISVLNDLDFSLRNKFPSKQKNKIGSRFRVAAEQNIVPFQEAATAIFTERPYPVKSAMIFGSNPLLSHANARKTGEALRKLDFLVVADMFMTPTAAIADIVLPVATHLEYNDLSIGPNYVAARPKLIDPPGDCLSDLQWINLMAQTLGLKDYFWDDEMCAIDEILAPAGLTFRDLMAKRIIWTQHSYRKYRKRGFNTPSGKVELFSKPLAALGIEPLPVYNAPHQSPLVSTHLTSEYPLVLTSCKSPFFFHSSYRNIRNLRRRSPEPVVELNPVTAGKLGLSQGDLVCIETPIGRIKQRLHVNADLEPRVVVAAYGWWYPEQGVSSMFGWQESNLNMLTSSDPPYDPAMGAPTLRGIMCKVFKESAG